MFARVSTYGIVLAALLMTACSQNETELKTASEREPVPISFSFTSTQDNQATTRGEAENAQLRNTGFGVFATVGESAYPNLMYNQQVTYTYLADDNYQLDGQAQNGYWSYSPTKYWPMKVNDEGITVPQDVTFCAYSPYTEPADIVGATAGITSISNNSQAPYLTYKRYTNPNDSLDLLWDCQVPATPGTIKLNMRHALARLAVSIKLASAPAADTKVLIRRVTLSGTIAQSGKLNLAVAGEAPTWTDQETTSITIYTDSDPETNTASWGTINNDIRYVKDLPYNWQPAGLNATTDQNVITIGDHRGFLYLIPQASLTLDCRVDYTIMSSDGTTVSGNKEHNGINVATPLNGNKPYNLKLILTL